MMSERTYWMILIASFAAVALLIWFGLLPYGILEYNFGVNLLSSSIFMVLTIFFLSWLFTIREGRYWKAVKSEVYSDIGSELNIAFLEILHFVENGVNVQFSIMETAPSTKRDVVLNEVSKLKDAKEIQLNPIELNMFLEDKSVLEHFLEISRNLSDTEHKYYRFLSPELTNSLMKIQRYIRLLEYAFRLHATFKTFRDQHLGKILSGDSQREVVNKSISISLKGLIEEIYKIYKMGIEFPFP